MAEYRLTYKRMLPGGRSTEKTQFYADRATAESHRARLTRDADIRNLSLVTEVAEAPAAEHQAGGHWMHRPLGS